MALPPNQPVSIGDLRDHIAFATSTDVIDPVTKRSVKKFIYTSSEYACIRPIGTQFFYENINTDQEVSHTIYTRYRSDAMAYQYVVQKITLPDVHEPQELVFEIIRATEWMGIRIFTRFDCRLVQRVS